MLIAIDFEGSIIDGRQTFVFGSPICLLTRLRMLQLEKLVMAEAGLRSIAKTTSPSFLGKSIHVEIIELLS